jgi:TatD DNase family protein
LTRLVDSHAHLSGEEFDQDRTEVIERAFRSGIAAILCPGEITDSQNLENALCIADIFKNIISAAGVHPHLSKNCTDACLEKIEELAHSGKIHAVGEIGLDYHYNFSPPETQRKVFRLQLGLAQSLRLPVVIHSRNAAKDVMSAMKEERFTQGGILHCFTEDWNFAQHMLDNKFLISFSGILTYAHAQPLRDVAARLPLDKLLIETDSPYLVPEPFRGKIKRNEPIYVKETARVLADLKNETLDQVALITTKNFESFFQIAL